QVGIGVDLRAIDVQLATPDQFLLLALLNDGVEEAAKNVHAIAFADTRQAGMVRKRLTQIVPQIPAQAQSISRMPHELSFRAQSLEEHDELQFEEDHRINGGTTLARIALLHQFAYK